MCQLFYAEFKFDIDLENLIDIARPLLSEDGGNSDGFGIYVEYGEENRPYLWKTADNGASVVIPRHVRERLRIANRVMAHTRSKTRGEVKPWNSQPFLFRNVVGAHNGTIVSLSNSRYSDSRIFYKNISDRLRSTDRKHVLKVFRKELKRNSGTAALIFRIGGRTYFFRDMHRTLYKIEFQSRRGQGIILVTNRLTAHVLADILRNLNHAKIGYLVDFVEANKLFLIDDDLSILEVGSLTIHKPYQYQQSYYPYTSSTDNGHTGKNRSTNYSGALSLEDDILIKDGKSATYILSPEDTHSNIVRHIISITLSAVIGKKADTVRIKMPIPIVFNEGERDFFKKIASKDFYSLSYYGFRNAKISSKEDIRKTIRCIIHVFGYLQVSIGGDKDEGKLFDALIDRLVSSLPVSGSDDIQQIVSDTLLDVLSSVSSAEDLDLETGKKLFYILFGG